MKRTRIYALLILSFLMLSFYGCNKKDNQVTIDHAIVTNLSANEPLEKGCTVTITFKITEALQENVREVAIWLDDRELAIAQTFPFTVTWDTHEVETGYHTFKSKTLTQNGKKYLDEFTVRVYSVNNVPCPGASTVTDYDGNTYPTILIGKQCWMKENLKVIHFPDGTPVNDGTSVQNTRFDYTTKYYFNYNDDETYVETFGRLYNWMAAVNGEAIELDLNPSGIQGICPDGWHLPSDAEWKQLELFLGLPEWEVSDRDWRGSIQGGMLKARGTELWKEPNKGATDETGFSALPAGVRTLNEEYMSLGEVATFWSSTNHIAYTDTQNPAYRQLQFDDTRIWRYRGFHGYITFGRSIRCVKDFTTTIP
jgi:uncharacterized protein (TIGR02145 family)